MTYEEYKNGNKGSNFLKKFFSKLFLLVIFVLFIMIGSNVSDSFKNFIIDDVLNKSMDFSFINKFTSKITDIFNDGVVSVNKEVYDYEEYLDGIKYIYDGQVTLKNSGIVTYIGSKEGYNNTVIVQQSNGYYALYGNISESVKLYDYITAGEVIGTSSGEYYYVLYKDDEPVDINEY